MKPIDKGKKSNVKCEHCGNYMQPFGDVYADCFCKLNNKPKSYWNRCKSFVWREDREYKEDAKARTVLVDPLSKDG